MPIYEFYCADCNTLFSFFSAAIDTETRPDCPRCGRARLERRPARFATLRSGGGEAAGEEEFAGLDEDALERAMGSLEGELAGLEDDADPRQLAGILRKLGEASGMEPGPKMEEILDRLEAGTDPDELDDDLEGLDAGEESMADFFRLKKKLAADRSRRPAVDDELYFL